MGGLPAVPAIVTRILYGGAMGRNRPTAGDAAAPFGAAAAPIADAAAQFTRRALKTAGLAGPILFFAASAHAAAGGAVPAGLLPYALLLPLVGACAALSRFRLAFLGTAAVLALGQAYVHLILSLGAHAGASTAGGGYGTPAGALAGGMSAHHAGGVGPVPVHGLLEAGHGASGGGHSSPSMLLMHAVGTLASAAMVASVEAALWVLTALVIPWISRLGGLSVPCAPQPALLRWAEPPRRSAETRAGDPSRGPPRFLSPA